MSIPLLIFIIFLLIAIPIGLAIGKATDKTQGKNSAQWEQYQKEQSEIAELKDRLNELEGGNK